MKEIEVLTIIIITINGVVTYKGLKDISFMNKFSFNVDEVLINRDYKRLISSGFLHVNWSHFAFNMITLYFFSQGLYDAIGVFAFLALYFSSLVGGNLLALYIHRNHPDYTAIGASGAVSGIIFASIGLFPGMNLGFILFPAFVPAWLFGLAYVLYSIYGIKSQKDNIGHEAHLGGGIIGLLIAMVINPNILITNYLPIALMLIPSLTFLLLIIKKPHILILPSPFSKTKKALTFEDKYNSNKVSKQAELNRLLDKINKKGYNSLSKKEKHKLEQLSK